MAACGRFDEDQTAEMKRKVDRALWGLRLTSFVQCGLIKGFQFLKRK